jgi:hypothetical protein
VAERPTVEALEHERARAAEERVRADALAEQFAELERAQREASVEPEPEPVHEPRDERERDAVPADPLAPVWHPAAQRAFSAALGMSEDWRGTLKHAVKVLGAEGQWDAVVAWLPDGRQGVMKCAAAWVGESLSSSTFETQVWQHRQKLPAAADRNGHTPQPVLELASAKDALLKIAAAEGMGSAVLVPIGDGSQLIGMVQLFSSYAGPLSAELMVSLDAVALQLAATARLLTSASTPHWRFGRL